MVPLCKKFSRVHTLTICIRYTYTTHPQPCTYALHTHTNTYYTITTAKAAQFFLPLLLLLLLLLRCYCCYPISFFSFLFFSNIIVFWDLHVELTRLPLANHDTKMKGVVWQLQRWTHIHRAVRLITLYGHMKEHELTNDHVKLYIACMTRANSHILLFFTNTH